MPLSTDEQKVLGQVAKTDSWIARNPGKTLAIGVALVIVIGLQLFHVIP